MQECETTSDWEGRPVRREVFLVLFPPQDAFARHRLAATPVRTKLKTPPFGSRTAEAATSPAKNTLATITPVFDPGS
ncbi:MAG TPA: hypothetical protein GXX55_08810 [Firmicutes bacterium]|nr:hypothetical protein [Bacillota bacterium]